MASEPEIQGPLSPRLGRVLAIAPWALGAALILVAYLPTWKWMIARWDEPESYMAHGWLIAPISAWLLWRDRARIAAAAGKGSPAGLWLMLSALAVHLLAGLADVSSISGLTIAPLALGFVWLVFGRRSAQSVWFPLAFLTFMVPPPEFILSKMNFSLKLLAADMATAMLNLSGMPAIREGSFMIFGDSKLAVGDVCSGLRSLLALLSLSVLYAWLVREKGKSYVIGTLAAAVPAAVVGNGMRIFLVACLVTGMGQEAVFKPIVGTWDLHLFTGALIFIAAFGCLYLVTAMLDRLHAGRDSGWKSPLRPLPSPPPLPETGRGEPVRGGFAFGPGRAWSLAALAMLMGSALLSNTVLFRQVVQGTTELTRRIPSQLGPWVQIDEAPPSPAEVRGLETKDIVKRTYSDGKSTIELVVAYIAHSSRKSAHAQEACLRGAGAMVGSVALTRMRTLPVQAKILSIDLRDRRHWVYYWYKMGNRHTAEFLLSSLRMFLAGLSGHGSQGTSLIRLLTPETRGESQEAIRARMEEFAGFLLPELDKNLP